MLKIIIIKCINPVVRTALTILLNLFFGKGYRVHRMPFGFLSGRYIYIAPRISVRMFLGLDERALTRAARKIIKPGDVIYDVGAHIGFTSVLFCSLTGEKGTVCSFELIPSTADILRKSLDANNFSFCKVFAVGASDTARELTIASDNNLLGVITKAESGMSQDWKNKGERCTIVRLDDFIRENGLPLPQMIKMDIEHEEVRALSGMENLIDTCHPVFIIEFHSADLLRGGYRLLSSKGYRFYTLDNRPISADAIEGYTQFWSSVICIPDSPQT